MRIDILTLFPEMFSSLKESIIGRAKKQGKIEINLFDIRSFSKDKHKKCDDEPYGGGAGMVMTPQPICSAFDEIDKERKALHVYLSPKGKVFSQSYAKELVKNEWIILLCGHYEGIDQRIIDLYIDSEISIGDYVLTGGEIPAMVVTDCICRLVDGVINADSLGEESFENGLLEYPQYTRPQTFMGLEVPQVLTSGNHQEIAKWRKQKAEEITAKVRPDLKIRD